MTLAIVSSRIEADKNTVKVDGRCYNVRSHNKTKWEVFKLDQLQKKQKRNVKPRGLVRGVYSKEEMAEYKEIERSEREAMTKRAEAKKALNERAK